MAAAPVDPEVAEEEALGDAEELAEDEGVAELEDEAEDVLLALFVAVESEEADEPSPDPLRVWPVWVEVVVVVVVVDGEEPALRTGAPAKTPTTMEMLKTAMMAAAMPIGLPYFLIPSRGRTGGVPSDVPSDVPSGSDPPGRGITFVASVITRVSPVAVFGCQSSAVSTATVAVASAP